MSNNDEIFSPVCVGSFLFSRWIVAFLFLNMFFPYSVISEFGFVSDFVSYVSGHSDFMVYVIDGAPASWNSYVYPVLFVSVVFEILFIFCFICALVLDVLRYVSINGTVESRFDNVGAMEFFFVAVLSVVPIIFFGFPGRWLDQALFSKEIYVFVIFSVVWAWALLLSGLIFFALSLIGKIKSN